MILALILPSIEHRVTCVMLCAIRTYIIRYISLSEGFSAGAVMRKVGFSDSSV